MGAGSKIISVILRLSELCSAIIVVGLLGRFFYLVNIANASANGRLVYAEVISALELIFSIILVFPAKYSFYAFPLDIIFFICSIVAFSLLADLNSSCTSGWYYNYWGFYWGRFWRVPGVPITSAGCSSWRSILAFLFLGAMAWMLSGILGAINTARIREGRETHRTTAMKEKLLHKKHHDQDSFPNLDSQQRNGAPEMASPPQTV